MASVQQAVVDLINTAQLEKDNKLECLRKVHELLIHKNVELLDSFFEEVVAFQQDPSMNVRKFVINFIEEVCKSDALYIDKALPSVLFLLDDQSTAVAKRAASAAVSLYPGVIKLFGEMTEGTVEEKELWEMVKRLKEKAVGMVLSENDGCRTLAVKFMEAAVLAQTDTHILPDQHPFLHVPSLREECSIIVKSLFTLAQAGSSSVNVMACMTSLVNIAKQRVQYVPYAVDVVVMLSAHQFSSFTESQKNSLKKQLKVQGLNLLRESHVFEYKDKLSAALVELGCTQNEVSKAIAKAEANLYRKRHRLEGEEEAIADEPEAKKFKEQELEDEDAYPLPLPPEEAGTAMVSGHQRCKELSLVEEITAMAGRLVPNLAIHPVVETVIQAMQALPADMPAVFRNAYKVTNHPGTPEQIQETALLLAAQMVSQGVSMETSEMADEMDHSSSMVRMRARMKRQSVLCSPKEERAQLLPQPSVDQMTASQESAVKHIAGVLGLPEGAMLSDPDFIGHVSSKLQEEELEGVQQDHKGEAAGGKGEEIRAVMEESGIADILSGMQGSTVSFKPTTPTTPVKMPPTTPTQVQKLKRSKLFRITDLARPLSEAESSQLQSSVFRRLLSNSVAPKEQWQMQDYRLVALPVCLAQAFDSLKEDFATFVVSEEGRRGRELAMAWLYREYAADRDGSLAGYEEALLILLETCQSVLGPRNKMFTQLLQDAPCVPGGALQMIESYLHTEEYSVLGLTALKDLVQKKGGPKDAYFQILLDATLGGSTKCRANAVAITKQLYATEELKVHIEDYLHFVMSKLLCDPPQEEDQHIFGEEWTEQSVKLCLGLFCTLLPLNHHLLLKLAEVYAKTSPQVKRLTLKQIEPYICDIPVTSPGVSQLIQKCPMGAETLVLRVISILVESEIPPHDVVLYTKGLYERSGKDVRFLIPVMKGLSRKEISDALPRIITLSSTVMKTVIQKLLMESNSPLRPSELLVALHAIDCNEDDSLMKAVIKATTVCFAEKAVTTAPVLKTAIQQILNMSPLPVILMRTVLQSLSLYPTMLDFVLNVLEQLIAKQVWELPKLWQGFIRCCEVTKAHSIPVLLQLPQEQLQAIISTNQALKVALDTFVEENSTLDAPHPPTQALPEMTQARNTSELGDMDSDVVSLE